jgi:hypothetical protein
MSVEEKGKRMNFFCGYILYSLTSELSAFHIKKKKMKGFLKSQSQGLQYSSEAEHIHSMHNTLGSIPRTPKCKALKLTLLRLKIFDKSDESDYMCPFLARSNKAAQTQENQCSQ